MAKGSKQAVVEDDAAAVAATVKGIQAKVTQEPPVEDEAEHVEIDLDEDEEDDSEEPGRPPARERRRNSYREAQEAREAAERRAEEETVARRRAEEEAHRLRTQGPQGPPDVQQQIHQEHRRIHGLKGELHKQIRLEEQAAGANGLSQERIEFFQEQARQLTWAENRLAAYALEMENAPVRAQQMREHHIRQTYPDIVAIPAATAYGISMFNALVAEGWDPNSNATLEEAAKRTRDNPKFGLKKSPKADPATRARLSGAPRGASNSAPQTSSGKIRLDKKEQRIAREIYPEDTLEVAYRKHAKQLQKRASKKAAAAAE